MTRRVILSVLFPATALVALALWLGERVRLRLDAFEASTGWGSTAVDASSDAALSDAPREVLLTTPQ